ncbi:MAG: HNH endonuclease [Lachnospiraceae bacterium]|nr:HNH endonuclease [Lachnospiraceae bacterium]
MAEYHSSKIDYDLKIDGKYYNSLDIEGFSHMMKDPSYCYKFYWLEAIVQLISEGVTETTFDAVINEMICNAWYSVREFHVHLSGMQADGQVRDGLERAILRLAEISDLPSHASKVEIKNEIAKHEAQLKEYKEQLTNMVPYRALAAFSPDPIPEHVWNSVKRTIDYFDRLNHDTVILPYTLGLSSKLKKEITFHPAWIEMIQNHTVTILGWIQYEKMKWLQNNNPEVPGLVYKLAPMDEKMRRLGNVRRLWEGILDVSEVRDIFTGQVVVPKKYDVDHFIPWSFVMNDELWNLMPMDSSLNSSKSNNLPKWTPFFARFAANQYLLYQLIHESPGIHKLFEACFRDNLHSIWAIQELYRKGNSQEVFYGILEKNMQPVYDSARRQGYEVWKWE